MSKGDFIHRPDEKLLAVTTNGSVYGWGNNWNGQLGVYTGMVTQTSNAMVVAGISNVVLVCAPPQDKGKHSLAVTVEQGVTRLGVGQQLLRPGGQRADRCDHVGHKRDRRDRGA